MFLWNIAVTSLAEVWIEMEGQVKNTFKVACHFPCGSVDWNYKDLIDDYVYYWSLPLRKCGLKFPHGNSNGCRFCHFPCGSVDWNKVAYDMLHDNPSHFPCGSVDWNRKKTERSIGRIVTSLAEVWIEIMEISQKSRMPQSLPLRKCGLK